MSIRRLPAGVVTAPAHIDRAAKEADDIVFCRVTQMGLLRLLLTPPSWVTLSRPRRR